MNYHCPRPPKQRAFDTSLLMWRRRFLSGTAFSPASLFASGEDGGWYDPSDLTTLFQERTGASATTPSGVGDVVGTILDKSGNGNHLVAPSDAARPLLQTEGGRYYLDFDGVDDILFCSNAWLSSGDYAVSCATGAATGADDYLIAEGSSSSNNPIFGVVRSDSPDADRLVSYYRDNSSSVYLAVTAFSTNTFLNGNVRVITVTGSASTYSQRVDGVGITTLTPTQTATTTDRHSIGGLQRASASNFSAMKLYGAVSLDRALTTAERENLEIYLANKSGATLV